MIITEAILAWAQTLWDYHHMQHELKPADCILVLGSHDTRVAERAAELYLQGMAPFVVFSGGLGRLTEGVWQQTEADRFAEIALKMGVPNNSILIENKSTNTGENILFTQEVFKAKGIDPERFIVVQKPYMERRSYATFKKHWPDKHLLVTSPQISFKHYSTPEMPLWKVISIMTGDLQRIRVYAEKGFQVYQHIPDHVWTAYENLVEAGFNQQLVK